MYKTIRPLLFSLDPETAHNAVRFIGTLASFPIICKLIHPFFEFRHPLLSTRVEGISFPSPIGLAAGFDKNAEMMNLMEALGFGFLEIGSVTARPCEGNPKPRLFRLIEDEALINRMGLCNEGALSIKSRIEERTTNIPIGVNIAKTNDAKLNGDAAIEDYIYTFTMLHQLVDYLVLNISCPNTGDGKTFEDPIGLDELLQGIRSSTSSKKPVFLKLSSDLTFDQIGNIIEVAKKYSIRGYVLCNTSMDRSMLKTTVERLGQIGRGGISGKPLRKKALERIRFVYKNFNKPTIIGVGGVFSAEDVYAQLMAGASLVQLYTSLVYEGPSIVKKIHKGLIELLLRDEVSTITNITGIDG